MYRILVTGAVQEQCATGLDKEHKINQRAINWRATDLFYSKFYQPFHLLSMETKGTISFFVTDITQTT